MKRNGEVIDLTTDSGHVQKRECIEECLSENDSPDSLDLEMRMEDEFKKLTSNNCDCGKKVEHYLWWRERCLICGNICCELCKGTEFDYFCHNCYDEDFQACYRCKEWSEEKDFLVEYKKCNEEDPEDRHSFCKGCLGQMKECYECSFEFPEYNCKGCDENFEFKLDICKSCGKDRCYTCLTKKTRICFECFKKSKETAK